MQCVALTSLSDRPSDITAILSSLPWEYNTSYPFHMSNLITLLATLHFFILESWNLDNKFREVLVSGIRLQIPSAPKLAGRSYFKFCTVAWNRPHWRLIAKKVTAAAPHYTCSVNFTSFFLFSLLGTIYFCDLFIWVMFLAVLKNISQTTVASIRVGRKRGKPGGIPIILRRLLESLPTDGGRGS